MPLMVLIYDAETEREEFEEVAIRSPRYRLALSDLYQKLRSKLKHEEISDTEATVYEQVRDWLAEACTEHEIEVP